MPKHFAPFAILPILLINTSVYAQVRDAPPERTIWNHNGSLMYLAANGSSREFHYEKPRQGMLEAGAKAGSLLFRGKVNDGQYSGAAYIFNPRCGQVPFQVKGAILDNDERIVLTGQAPRIGRNCQAYASYSSTLEFRILKSVADAPTSETQKESESKPEAPQAGGDTLDTASEQVPTVNDRSSPTKEVTGNIARPPLGTSLPQQGAKNEIFGDPLDNYVFAGSILVLIGALIFQISRKLFWRNTRFY
jgi:hypothetical protein